MTQKTAILMFGIFSFAGLFLGLQVSHATQVTCPEVSLGETAEDCPWAGVTRSLIQASESGENLSARMAELVPDLVEQIKRERSQIDEKNAWGQSINFDEGAKAIIVDPRIMDEIIERFGVKKREDRIVHAGAEHVYGYLFSNLRTSFGYKRARWVKNELETGFKLPNGILGPKPQDGAFFSNITYFAARVAFRNEPRSLIEIKKGHNVAGALKAFEFDKLKTQRLKETIRFMKDNEKRVVEIRTDFVPFLKQPSDEKANSHLLIYSILDSKNAGPQLITAFPVNSGFVKNALDPKGLGSNEKISTRYNAHVIGITGTSFQGTRETQ